MHVDYDAARKERLRLRDPVEFTLGGVRFRCRKAISSEELFAAMDREAELGSQRERFEFHSGFIADCLDSDAARKRWKQVLSNRADPITEDDITAIIRDLVGVYAGRPTSPSNGSSAGRRTTGRSSKSSPTGRSPAKLKAS